MAGVSKQSHGKDGGLVESSRLEEKKKIPDRNEWRETLEYTIKLTAEMRKQRKTCCENKRKKNFCLSNPLKKLTTPFIVLLMASSKSNKDICTYRGFGFIRVLSLVFLERAENTGRFYLVFWCTSECTAEVILLADKTPINS
ncbi:CLUMA_CG000363, isoform A [Clunio marinus]|uniref:CLUMA_CG000363, isoform A n=1 Tax=Clunio marinus TaxID=568069 RepID=A0A1J1HJI6_9DIPT|nr:CLUMA_CG000363, isoform A [Clunio marinus]